MKDAIGNELQVGDIVLNFYTWSGGGIHSRKRRITRFTEKCIFIEGTKRELIVRPENVVKTLDQNIPKKQEDRNVNLLEEE
jgi:hypothetical protein